MVMPSFWAWGSKVKMSPWLAQRSVLVCPMTGTSKAAVRAAITSFLCIKVAPFKRVCLFSWRLSPELNFILSIDSVKIKFYYK